MGVSTRQIQKSNTRKKIIDAAYRVFSERGFTAATSVIAKEAGVSHGSIFAHFPTLDDLLICLLSDFGDRMGESLHRLAKKGGGMEDLLKEHLNVLEEYEAFYSRLISEKNNLPEEAKNTLAALQSTAAFHFARVAEREMEKGTVKKLPVHMLFNTWLGLVHHYLLNAEFFSAAGGPVLRRYKTDLLHAYLKLIKKESEDS